MHPFQLQIGVDTNTSHTPPVEVEEAFWELQCFSLRCKEVSVRFSVHVSKSEQKSAPVINYGFYMKIRLVGFGKKTNHFKVAVL